MIKLHKKCFFILLARLGTYSTYYLIPALLYAVRFETVSLPFLLGLPLVNEH